MRRWATALRQAAYDPSDTGQGSASRTTPLGLHLDYSMEFWSRRVGDIPPALTSSLLPSFPVLEKPRPGEPLPPPAAQQPEETDSPQSPLPDEEGKADIQPHRQKMLVQFPFQKRKAAGPQGTPSKESTGRFGVSSDKEDESVVTVSDDGSDPDGASTSTGRTVPTSSRKRSRRANHLMRHLRRDQQTGMRLHPNRSRTCLPKQRRPFSLRQGMSCRQGLSTCPGGKGPPSWVGP